MRHIPLEPLIGKPVVVYKDGKRREIGTITSATIHDDGLTVHARISDEELMHDYIRPLELMSVSIGG